MTTKQVRWRCQQCDHGLLAPMKPRKNDVRRYCLPCSSKTGKLVERTAPALEKQREKRAALVQQRQSVKRARTAAAMQPIKERKAREKKRQQLFEKEADRIWSLFHPEGTSRRRPPITLVYSKSRGASGNWNGYEARIRIPKSSLDSQWDSDEWVWLVLAHELCHAVTGRRHNEGSHGRSFYVALKSVVEKRWKVRIDFSFVNGYTDSSHSWGYKVDYAMLRQLRSQGCVKFGYQMNPKPCDTPQAN